MSLSLSDRTIGDVTVVDIEGKMNTGTSPDADVFLGQLISAGANRLLLNMKGVDYISSSGLRVVLSTGKKLNVSKGKLVFCGLNTSVGEVFRVSGFNSIFPVFDSEQEALDSF
jgi:anti-sigma B factor antagonist